MDKNGDTKACLAYPRLKDREVEETKIKGYCQKLGQYMTITRRRKKTK